MIYSAPASSGKITVIEALAGTGKTSTLIEIIKHNPRVKFRYVSFMRSVKSEMITAVRNARLFNCEPLTMHSVAFSAIKKHYRHPERLKVLKAPEIAELMFPGIEPLEKYFVSRLFRKFCIGAARIDDFINAQAAELISANGKRTLSEQDEHALKLVRRMWESMRSPETTGITYDFTVKYFIETLGADSLAGFDVLLVDEAQDLSPPMNEFVLHAIRHKKPVVAVGDNNQSIMSFTRSKNILPHLVREHPGRAERHLLTNSFRFSRGSEIERSANILLAVRGLKITGAARHTDSKIDQTALLARTNKAVLEHCHELASYGKNYDLVGGISYYKGENGNKLSLLRRLHDLAAGGKGAVKIPFVGSFGTMSGLKEFAETNEDIELLSDIALAEFICSKRMGVDGFFRFIGSYCDAGSSTKVSTIHKAKGSGYDEVRILPSGVFDRDIVIGVRCDLNANFRISERLNLAEELNILYVAVTRARKQLEIIAPEYVEWLDFLEMLCEWDKSDSPKDPVWTGAGFPSVLAKEYLSRVSGIRSKKKGRSRAG